MNLRFDKVIRSVGFGLRKVYSLVLNDDALYLIKTGSVGALKHFQLNADQQVVVGAAAGGPITDRGVKALLANEAAIDTTPIEALQQTDHDHYRIRLEAIEDVAIRQGKSPEMLIKLTGSDHFLVFPFATFDDVQTLQRALNKWSLKP
jgi:hypothetical protein